MRYIKSYIMFALMAFAFTGCKMDDLKDDVNDLKDRVTSLEQQIKILNENLEVISYLFNDNLVITSCKPNGTEPDYDSYTITFSDNSEFTLNLGSESSVRLPKMSIVDGEWVIEGKETDIPVSNEVEGINGYVTKFKLELDTTEGKYYWTVSYNGGSDYEELTNENGRIYVTVDDILPADQTFYSAALSDDGKYFELKLVASSEVIRRIPIVSDLKCELSEIYSQYDGKWTFGKRATQTVKLKVTGDDILVYAPTGWTYSIGEKDESGVVAISVTAPAADGVGTRLSANNKEDLSVMVRKDNYWAVWKTKVGLVSGGKYNKFDTNGTITIDTETISKTDNSFYYRIGDPDYQVTQPGVYFLAKGLKWNANIKSDIDGNLYFIDESDEGRTATVNVAKQLSFKATDNLYFSDVIFDASATTNSAGDALQYPIAIGEDNHHLENLVFYNSVISIVPTKSVAYIGNKTRWIANTKIKNSDFICNCTAENQQFTLIGISSVECSEYKKIELDDNVFYSITPELKPQFVAFNGNSGGVTEFIMTNNTFVNVVLGQNGLLNIGTLNKFTTQKNIFWYDYSLSRNQFIINAKTGPSEGQYDNNYVYCSATNKTWNIFKDGSTESLDGEEFSIIDSDPFEGGQFDIENGIFVPNSEYNNYGAQRNLN